MSRSSDSTPSHQVFCAWKSHRGNFRPNNEDAVLLESLDRATPAAGGADTPSPDDMASGAPALSAEEDLGTGGNGCLAVICDGVGGGTAGEIASSLATRAFRDRLRAELLTQPDLDTDAFAQACLLAAVRDTHEAILRRVAEDRALEGMASTLTAAWLRHSRLHLAQVGDSRLYRLRADELEQLSQDQSLVGGLRRSGTISEAEARRHPLRNIIDQAVGGSLREVVPEVAHFDLQPGDELLLCTDGLNDALTDNSLKHLLLRLGGEAPEAAAQAMLQAALDSAGRDNVSLALLRVEDRGARRWVRAVSRLASRIVPGRS